VPVFTSAASTTFVVGSAGSFTVTAVGSPAPTLSESSNDTLPSGVKFNAATGVLGGTPGAGTEGTYTLHFTATNSAGSSDQTFTLKVDQHPAITSTRATFTVNTQGSFTLNTSGFPAPTLSLKGTLPKGLSFTSGTGVISGKPAPGTSRTYTLHFTASNGIGTAVTKTFTLIVKPLVTLVPVTSQVSVTYPTSYPALGHNEFKGTFTITNPGPALTAPITLAFSTLPSGVKFVSSSTGTKLGMAKSLKLAVVFNTPNASLLYFLESVATAVVDEVFTQK